MHERCCTIRFVRQSGNVASRAHPARGSRRLPPTPASSRNDTRRKPCSRRKSPTIPAHAGTAVTGLSRRRSRVRVPSLPLNCLQIGIFCCPARRYRPPASLHPAQIPHANRPEIAAGSRTAPAIPASRRTGRGGRRSALEFRTSSANSRTDFVTTLFPRKVGNLGLGPVPSASNVRTARCMAALPMMTAAR